MNAEFYEKYHSSGIGTGTHVQAKKIPLNNACKAGFVEKLLRGKVLDVGCGGGFDCNYFRNRGHNVFGTDISETAIGFAKKSFPKVPFFLHNFEEHELSQQFDTIICFEVLEHIFDYKTFLKNVFKSLSAGGTLILTTPNIFGFASWLRLLKRDGKVLCLSTEDESHIRFFAPDTLKHGLEFAGFGQITIKTFSQTTSKFSYLGLGGNLLAIAKKEGVKRKNGIEKQEI